MAPPRVIDPTGIYHVGSNGNFDCALYLEARDRSAFLELYARVARKRKWTTFAYCLMTTHFHFVVQLADGGLSEGMRELNGCFSRRMNAIMGRTRRGHFFKNRFDAKAVEDEAYLLGVCRYVVLNPSKPVSASSPSNGAGAATERAPACARRRASLPSTSSWPSSAPLSNGLVPPTARSSPRAMALGQTKVTRLRGPSPLRGDAGSS